MALNALKPLQATMWRPSGVMKFVKTPSRGLAEINQPLAPSKPVGAFRGGLFGFLLGNFVSSVGLYYYVLEDYKVSNELLTNDINCSVTGTKDLKNEEEI
ncbi:hypothetical protein OnM2_037068 [Erysiphe neolycopersici]|uniref:Uncharacterized protein n=1 Tax=Erysiphe neolycopersici TaxID=212602 RepID=A0A420HWY1_9PEZI|nr:hypothetical protein OnM2_037068 [Erysiphe neolycopersici]